MSVKVKFYLGNPGLFHKGILGKVGDFLVASAPFARYDACVSGYLL